MSLCKTIYEMKTFLIAETLVDLQNVVISRPTTKHFYFILENPSWNAHDFLKIYIYSNKNHA